MSSGVEDNLGDPNSALSLSLMESEARREEDMRHFTLEEKGNERDLQLKLPIFV